MPDLAHGLQHLLDYPGDVEADLATFFSVEEENFGELQTHELKPGGSDVPVTNSNRQEYVELYTQWVLQDSVQTQFAAFSEGFHQARCILFYVFDLHAILSFCMFCSFPICSPCSVPVTTGNRKGSKILSVLSDLGVSCQPILLHSWQSAVCLQKSEYCCRHGPAAYSAS